MRRCRPGKAGSEYLLCSEKVPGGAYRVASKSERVEGEKVLFVGGEKDGKLVLGRIGREQASPAHDTESRH